MNFLQPILEYYGNLIVKKIKDPSDSLTDQKI